MQTAALRPALLGLDSVLEGILNQPPALVLALVFLVPALEASVMAGVIFPGEITVLLGGVVASQGRTPLWAVLIVAILGAVSGDAVGFAIGRRWGPALLRRLPPRLVPPQHVARGLETLRRLGWRAVVVGRWTAVLRAVVPGLAGMSGLRPRTFLLANVAGGSIWASSVALAGYVAGQSWRSVQHTLGQATAAAAVGLLLVVSVIVLIRRRKRKLAA